MRIGPGWNYRKQCRSADLIFWIGIAAYLVNLWLDFWLAAGVGSFFIGWGIYLLARAYAVRETLEYLAGRRFPKDFTIDKKDTP